jgi:hypothetical protein
MAEMPWFKFYAADFLLDPKVDAMPREAVGLLICMWCVCAREGSCPVDSEGLARKTMCPVAYVLAYRTHCDGFFELRDGRLFSRRMERERQLSESQRKKANTRWAKKSKVQNSELKNSELRIQNSEGGNANGIATCIPPPPSGAAAVDFSSLENSDLATMRAKHIYTERDFFERDLRKLHDADEEIEKILRLQPNLGADEIEEQRCKITGLAMERIEELREYQFRPARRPTGKVQVIA